ncbi:MAG: phenylalanine--tRNA ligase subunit alpha [bacterium]
MSRASTSEIETIIRDFESDIVGLRDEESLRQIRVKYLGRKGIISRLFDQIKEIPPEERRHYGERVNRIKDTINQKLQELELNLKTRSESRLQIDLTLPATPRFVGGLHPLTQLLEEIVEIFLGLGFTIEEGPECETVYLNFDALNTTITHPSRSLSDTFYLDIPGGDWLLRTHTSPVQVRVMKRQKPPIRIIAPGRTYRNDKPDATHSPVFTQVEGLYIDHNVTFSDLKGTLLSFFQSLFGKDLHIRLRPSYFPFTEPSAEVDISCLFCRGEGCRICKNSGWLEMAGAGMVHPAVLREGNINPEEFTGWAFGMGVERIAILLYGVDDIRLFYEGDLRFLSQF